MKLAQWRAMKGMTQAQLADELGCVLTTVARYELGIRRPDERAMIAIYELTRGLVQPNDFYRLPLLREATGELFDVAA